MTDLHRYAAYVIVAAFALLALWTLLAFVRNKAPGDAFWNLLALVQIVIGLQAIVGAVLFATGVRPSSNGPQWLHYTYGALFPALVLVVAHRAARGRWESIPWAVFGVAAFVCFGLTFRALQSGLGLD